METRIDTRAAALLSIALAVAPLACGQPRLSREGLGGAGAVGAGGAPATPPAVPTFTLPDAGGFDAATPAAPAATCGLQRHQLTRLDPELMLLLDRSGSMNMGLDLGSPATRWEDATAAIRDVLTLTAGSAAWGLKTFPTVSGCDERPAVEVPIGPDVQTVINAVAGDFPARTGAGTPTAEALAAANAYLGSRATINPKYIVLATDGEPTCPQSDHALAAQNARDQVLQARTAGFPTFVIGIATAGTEADKVLADLAMAGGRPQTGATAYYAVGDRQSLVTALRKITGSVATCTFPLDRQAPSPEDVAVDVDGTRIMRDPSRTNGWDYADGNRAVILYGAACERVKSGSVLNLEIIFGCPHQPIP